MTAADVARVFVVLKRLRSEGLALLYISHRMHEIAELADECSVFRNGMKVATYRRRREERQRGHRDDDRAGIQPRLSATGQSARELPAPPALETRGLGWMETLRDISLHVGAGEIVGLGGLDGQGQRELLLALFGVLRGCKGEILIDGKPAKISGPAAAKGNAVGMALIPEDRKTEGLMLPMSVRDNLTFAAFERISRRRLHRSRDRAIADRRDDRVAGDPHGQRPDIAVGSLSGGNQQKVVIAKWLMNKPRIILLNDPTRGIDVGTKQEIYALLRKLADAGGGDPVLLDRL